MSGSNQPCSLARRIGTVVMEPSTDLLTSVQGPAWTLNSNEAFVSEENETDADT